MSPVPLLDLKAQYQTIRGEVETALQAVLASQHFILGPEVESLEKELCAYLGCRHAVGVSNGSDALVLALQALGVGPGDEVITTAFSFFATAGSIVRLGARPVLVDIDLSTYNLDLTRVAARLGPRTRAIMPVHLFGRCAEMEELARLAPGVPLVEDAAQAIGAERAGHRAGSIGRLGCLSFFPSKNLGGFGDGGMVCSSDPELAARVRALRVHGQGGADRYLHAWVGGNYRLDAIQAAVLRVKLRHLEDWTRGRRANATRYRQLFAEASLPVELPPKDAPGCRDVYNQFVIRVRDRDGLQRYLGEHKIGCAIYYPRGLHQQPCFADLGYKTGDFPATERAAAESLAIPVYPELTDAQLGEVVGRIAEFLRK
jgi:dTDP-4-amino-4,6-dideoxygalactose transaminase